MASTFWKSSKTSMPDVVDPAPGCVKNGCWMHPVIKEAREQQKVIAAEEAAGVVRVPDTKEGILRRMLNGICVPGAGVHVRVNGPGCQCGAMLVRR